MMETNFAKADLHIHSDYSRDAFSGVKAILKVAKERKLNVIAITDHHTLKGAKEARKLAPEFGVEVVIGEEITTKEGDLLAVFIENLIAPKRDILDTIKEIHQQGGLVIVPHPLNWFVGGISSKVLFQIFEKADGIELLNGSWVGKIKRKESEQLNKLFFNLAGVGGSDAHIARQVGRSYTLFPGKNANDLYQAIGKRLTFPDGISWTYKDRLLWLTNLPKLLYRHPKIPFTILSRLFKEYFFSDKNVVDHYSDFK